MAGVNKVILVGNLGKDPEVRHLEGGAAVANFPIATTEVYKDKTLYNKKDVILNDYWNESGLSATEDEQKIIKDIEEN